MIGFFAERHPIIAISSFGKTTTMFSMVSIKINAVQHKKEKGFCNTLVWFQLNFWSHEKAPKMHLLYMRFNAFDGISLLLNPI